MAKDLKHTRPRENPGAYIAPVFVFGLLSGLEGKDVDVDGYLRQHGVDSKALRTPGDRGITPIQYAALFYALVGDMKDECIGLFSRPFKPGSFALTAREGLSAIDLRSALKRMSSALNLLQDDIIFSLQSNTQEAGLHMVSANPERQIPVFAQETMVRVLWRLSAWLLNTPLLIRHFDFTYAEPADHDLYSLCFLPFGAMSKVHSASGLMPPNWPHPSAGTSRHCAPFSRTPTRKSFPLRGTSASLARKCATA